MKDLNTIVAPLTEIVKKILGFTWEIGQEKTFNLLKEKLILASLLVLPNFTKILRLNVMI
jgi:hypothetical protein